MYVHALICEKTADIKVLVIYSCFYFIQAHAYNYTNKTKKSFRKVRVRLLSYFRIYALLLFVAYTLIQFYIYRSIS